MADDTFDVIIIGGGPGGYVAAIRAAQLGLKTAVVERSHLGGICLNWGCIPTKSLLRTAETYERLRDAEAMGLRAEAVSFDTSGVVARSRAAAARLAKGVDGLLKKNKVPVIWGNAHLKDAGTVDVSETDAPPPRGARGAGTYSAKHIVLATGARPRVLPGIEPEKDRIWTYFDAMVPEEIPASLAIIGSGAIGSEFASFYASMGTEVTLIEALPQILPAEDDEIVGVVAKRFRKQGIALRVGTRVTGVERRSNGVDLQLANADGEEETLSSERVISAVGVVGNIEGFGLEELGVATTNGTIDVDGLGATNVPGLYAIGDVAGGPMLAHKASHEGIACVEAIAGGAPHSLDKAQIPSCTYCHPQVASIGLTERAAGERGLDVRVGRFPLIGSSKAVVLGETDGMVKTVFDAGSGRLVGAHLVGPDVTELIHGFAIAMKAGCTEEQLITTVFPHPTLSEAIHEGVLAASGRAIHI